MLDLLREQVAAKDEILRRQGYCIEMLQEALLVLRPEAHSALAEIKWASHQVRELQHDQCSSNLSVRSFQSLEPLSDNDEEVAGGDRAMTNDTQ